ncbi:MAG: valine--tRNA ligase, partial [Hyphomicrobiaceae bacterium]
VRSVRSEMNVPAGAKIPLVIAGASRAAKGRLADHLETIKRLARLETLSFEPAPPRGAVQIVLDDGIAALPLAGVVDLKAEAERLQREIAKAEGENKKIEVKLANAAFLAKAPTEVVEENKERLADGQSAIKKLEAALKRIAS